MTNYKVVYNIEVTAENPRKAALQVENILRDGVYRPCLIVTDEQGNDATIDLEIDSVEKGEKEEDTNKHVEILQHDISYFFRDTDLDIDECGEEHIFSCIEQGCVEGDLNITDLENHETYYGYWHIVKK